MTNQLQPEPVPDAIESASPARPVRPWKWDAVAFKAVQDDRFELTEQAVMLARLAAMQQAYAMTQRIDPASDGYWRRLFGIF